MVLNVFFIMNVLCMGLWDFVFDFCEVWVSVYFICGIDCSLFVFGVFCIIGICFEIGVGYMGFFLFVVGNFIVF